MDSEPKVFDRKNDSLNHAAWVNFKVVRNYKNGNRLFDFATCIHCYAIVSVKNKSTSGLLGYNEAYTMKPPPEVVNFHKDGLVGSSLNPVYAQAPQ